MHAILGFLFGLLVFYTSFQFIGEPFAGYLNTSSLILVFGAPLAIAMMSFDFGTLADALRVLGRSFRVDGVRDQARLMEDLYRFGRLLREGRHAEASRFLDDEAHPLLAELGPLALQRMEPELIAETTATVAFARIHRSKRAEEVLQSLGRASPAMGMTGTVIGMIHLLGNMENFDQLGAGMAVAMVSTLYGLVMQHVLYAPLARKIDTDGRRAAVNARLLERGLVAISTGRPLHDLRLLAGQVEGEFEGAAEIGEAA